MSSVVIFFIALIVLVVGCFLGWHANRAYFANGDVKSMHGRISGYRKTRMRSGLIAVGILVAALLVVSALAHH
jgi:divalent metal cation (Fe/Co/Zn/Cd) transporter